MLDKRCLFCGQQINLPIYWLRTRKFCSRKCYYKFMVGKPGHKQTPQTREKISKTFRELRINVNRRVNKETRLKMRQSHLGKKHSEETKKKIGKSISKSLIKYFRRKRKEDKLYPKQQK